MTTPNFAISELAPAQAQKHVTVNEGFRTIDAAMNLVVIRADFTAPPGSPAEGDKYIPFATASGAWTGKEDQVALFVNGAWVFFVPAKGWRAYNQTTNALLVFDGSAWVDFGGALFTTTGASGEILLWGVNTTPDSTNRLAVKSDAVLLSHDDVTPGTGDMVVTVNKDVVGSDAGINFQTGFSTRAIMGTLANDNFTLQVSANGSLFTPALTVTASTGRMTFAERLHADNGTVALPTFSFSGDPDTGLYRNANDQLGFATGGAQRFLLTNTQATVSTGDMIVNNAGTNAVVTVNKGATGNDAGFTFQNAFTTTAQIGALGDDNFTLKVGASSITALVADNSAGTLSFPEGVRNDTLTAYKTSVQNLTGPGTWDDITTWTGTHIAASGDLSWTASTGQAFVGKAGRFLVSYTVSSDITSGGTRSDTLAKLQKWNGSAWVDVEGTQHRMYNRQVQAGGTNAAWVGVLDLGGSEGLKLQATIETGTDAVVIDQAALTINRL